MRVLFCIVHFICLAGCAQLGGREGGADNLPSRGITGYEATSLGDGGSPYVLQPTGSLAFSEPCAIVREERVHLYVENVNQIGDAGSVVLFISEDGGESFGEPVVVASTTPIPSAKVSAPSVSCNGDACTMVAMAGDPAAMYIARGPAKGPFVWQDEPILLPTENFEAGGISSASAVVENSRILVYYTARENADSPPVIAGALIHDDGTVEKFGALLAPATDCTSPMGAPVACWNQDGVLEPEVRIATTGADRKVYRMFFTGMSNGDASLGFAASWDGFTFSPYAFNPVLEGGKSQPTNLRVGERYLLYYTPLAGWDTGKIGLAISHVGHATETF